MVVFPLLSDTLCYLWHSSSDQQQRSMRSFLYKLTVGDQTHLQDLHGYTSSSGAQGKLDFLSSVLQAHFYFWDPARWLSYQYVLYPNQSMFSITLWQQLKELWHSWGFLWTFCQHLQMLLSSAFAGVDKMFIRFPMNVKALWVVVIELLRTLIDNRYFSSASQQTQKRFISQYIPPIQG